MPALIVNRLNDGVAGWRIAARGEALRGIARRRGGARLHREGLADMRCPITAGAGVWFASRGVAGRRNATVRWVWDLQARAMPRPSEIHFFQFGYKAAMAWAPGA